MYGRCISRLCSSSSTSAFILENIPVLLSSAIAIDQLWPGWFSMLGLAIETEREVADGCSVLGKGGQGEPREVGMMGWSKKEDSFTIIIS
jgi:hypothetical protein